MSPQKVGSLSVQNIPVYISTTTTTANNKYETSKPILLSLPRNSNILERALTNSEVH